MEDNKEQLQNKISYISENKNLNLAAKIDIARANLYVFRDSNEKATWEDMLNKAEKAVSDDPIYAETMVDRVTEVIANLWKRIFAWKDFQKKIIRQFIYLIIVELIIISIYYFFVDIVKYGFFTSILFGLLGGSLGTVLNLGKDLEIRESNQLKAMKLALKPLVGAISAIVLFSLLKLNIIIVSPSLDQGFVIIVLSISAGYSEIFLTKALDNYVPKIFNQ